MKTDTVLYSNEKRHWQLWYFIVDTILSMSHPGPLAGSYPPVVLIPPGLVLLLFSEFSMYFYFFIH